MSLNGQLSDLPLHSVIQNLAANNCTGLLTLNRNSTNLGMLFFVKGTLSAFYSIRLEKLSWPQLLIASKTTTRDKLEKAGLTTLPGKQFPKKAVEAGVISSEELDRVFYSFVQEEIFDLFRLQSGEFVFDQTETIPDFFVYGELFSRLTFNITHLLMEGARQSDEWKRLSEVIDSPLVIFRKENNTAEDQDTQVILDLVDGNRNLLDLIDESHLPKINAMTAITNALQNGLIREATPDEIRKDIEAARSGKDNALERIKKIATLKHSSQISTDEKEKRQKELDEILLRSDLDALDPTLIRMQIRTDHIRDAKARQKANTRKRLFGLAVFLLISVIAIGIYMLAIQPEDNSAAAILSRGKSLEKQNPSRALQFYMRKLSYVETRDAQVIEDRISTLSKTVKKRFRITVNKLKSLARKGDAENVNALLATIHNEYEGIVPANEITTVHEQVKKLLDKQAQLSEKEKINRFVEEVALLIQSKKYREARNRIIESGYSGETAVGNLNKTIQSVEQELEAGVASAAAFLEKEKLDSARQTVQKVIDRAGDLPVRSRAEELLKKISQIHDNDLARLAEAKKTIRNSDPAAYLRMLEEIRKRHPDTPLARQAETEIRATQHRMKKAETLYQAYRKAAKAGNVQQAFSLAREMQMKFASSSIADKAIPKILVSSIPAGAAVSVNGKRVGATPVKTALKPEKTIITVVKNGFRPWKKELNLATCTTAEHKAQLVKKPLWEKQIGTITTFPVIHDLKNATACFGTDIKYMDLEKGTVHWTNTINRSATSFIDERGKKHLISEAEFWHTQGRSFQSGSSLYIPSLNNRLIKINLKTGSVEWEFPTKTYIKHRPAGAKLPLKNNQTFICAIDMAGNLYSINGKNGRKEKEIKLNSPPAGDLAIIDNNVYFLDRTGMWQTFNLMTHRLESPRKAPFCRPGTEGTLFSINNKLYWLTRTSISLVKKTGREVKKADIAETRVRSSCGIFSLQNNTVKLTSVPGLNRTTITLPESLNADRVLTGAETFACIMTADDRCLAVSIPNGRMLCTIELQDDTPAMGQAIGNTLILFGKKGTAAAFAINTK